MRSWFLKLPGNVRGTLIALFATALFTVASALVKYAAPQFHVFQILLFRQVIMLVLILPVFLKNFPDNLKTRRPGLHLLRLSGASMALVLGFVAVSNLPLATAISFSFTKTMFVTIMAFVLLSEPVGWRRILAVFTGFAGMLIMLRPDPGSAVSPYAIIATVAALGAGIAVTSVRRLSSTESAATLISYQAVFVGLLVTIPSLFVWKTPDFAGFVLLVAIGVVSALAQWLGVQSYRAGEVSVVTAMEYTKLIYATLIGLVVFAEWPDIKTFIGAAIIISASAYTLIRESRQK